MDGCDPNRGICKKKKCKKIITKKTTIIYGSARHHDGYKNSNNIKHTGCSKWFKWQTKTKEVRRRCRKKFIKKRKTHTRDKD